MNFLKNFLAPVSDDKEYITGIVQEIKSGKVKSLSQSLFDLQKFSKKYSELIGTAIPSLTLLLSDSSCSTLHAEMILEIFIQLILVNKSNDVIQKKNCILLFQQKKIIETLFLQLLHKEEAKRRNLSIHLLIQLCNYNLKKVQDGLLSCPNTVPQLVDLLIDPNEKTRDQGMLLISQIILNRAEIQKIVAYEGIFEKIFYIISAEVGRWGVEEYINQYFILILALLKDNTSNQV
ncbi:general vesicular transport factor [Anaeramoeba flamelloides]|uniref:General vesicular transport factor n=1 Tax=Anaeramoeba flamelloides TaxID=1746091 RepID=A0ABQ8ZEX4_9EUKA|nr:general vesicular transport factor [Anaeramoeba flamelloides]